MQPQPISPYGVTKYVGEIYAQVFGRVYGLENACIRYFNVFGPRQDPTSQYSGVLSRFMLAVIAATGPLFMATANNRAISPMWKMLWTRLCARARPKVLRDWCSTEVPASRITLNEVLKCCSRKITGQTIQAQYDAPRNGDIRDSQADVSLARKMLGYEPRVLFEEGLKRTWEWYKKTYTKSVAGFSFRVMQRLF